MRRRAPSPEPDKATRLRSLDGRCSVTCFRHRRHAASRQLANGVVTPVQLAQGNPARRTRASDFYASADQGAAIVRFWHGGGAETGAAERVASHGP
jgi:hypothetical protein